MFELNPRLPRAIRLQEFVIPFCDTTQSTKYDSTTKLILGSKYFDPSVSNWRLCASTTATLVLLLGTTNNANAAAGELYFVPSSGIPSIIATTPTTTNLTATKLTADVSAYFRPGASAGTFSPRTWITTFNGNDQSTCYGAWIEVKP